MGKTSLTILVADDNEDDRELIKRALSWPEFACDFHEATSVAQAMQACRQVVFDCATLDYSFPAESGLQGIAQLQAVAPHMPIIMVTGHGDEIVATEAMMAGAADYIPKSRISRTSLRRVIENAIEKASLRRKIAEQQEALASFNHVLAHDLKAPLSAMAGFAQLMRRGLGEGDVKNSAALCARIENAARRMSTLIDTLRAYNKADAHIVFEPVSMAQVLDDTLTNLDQIIQERQAQVRGKELPAVIGNPAMLTNLLQNLIANSIKFCEARTPEIQITARQQEGGEWLFAVKDNGIGIPEDSLEPIFDPFTRLHGRDRFEGTGLGLATCRRIIERHHGTIWCASLPGDGTTMFFTLPGVDKAALRTSEPCGAGVASPQ